FILGAILVEKLFQLIRICRFHREEVSEGDRVTQHDYTISGELARNSKTTSVTVSIDFDMCTPSLTRGTRSKLVLDVWVGRWSEDQCAAIFRGAKRIVSDGTQCELSSHQRQRQRRG